MLARTNVLTLPLEGNIWLFTGLDPNEMKPTVGIGSTEIGLESLLEQLGPFGKFPIFGGHVVYHWV